MTGVIGLSNAAVVARAALQESQSRETVSVSKAVKRGAARTNTPPVLEQEG